MNGGVFKIKEGCRSVKTHGVELKARMGMNSWAAFVENNERAHMGGDIAMTAQEINLVISTLRRWDISIVSLHTHYDG